MQKANGAWADFIDNCNFGVSRKQIAQKLEEKCEINTTFLDVLEEWQHSSLLFFAETEEAVLHRRWCWDDCMHVCKSMELAVSVWNWDGRREIVMKMSEEPKNRSDLQGKYEKIQVKNY